MASVVLDGETANGGGHAERLTDVVVVHDLAVPESILVRARADAVRRPLGEIEPEGLVVVLKFA